MNRTDRERNDPAFIADVLERAETMFLAFIDQDSPYCIPVNYAVSGNRIYIHSARSGLKLNCIQANPRVAFSAAVDIAIDCAHSTTWYKSVAGRGIAAVVADRQEKGLALDLIASRYRAACKQPASISAINRVVIIRIEITQISGKGHIQAG